jgi:phage major head subunit gpT-like protein
MGTHRLLEQAKIANAQIGFSTMFNNQLKMALVEPILDVAMRIPSVNRQEDFKFLGDIPQLRLWVDDRPMAKLRVETISVANQDWATGLRVDRNDILDDRLSLVLPRIQMLADRARQHVSKSLVELLLNGFTGVSFPIMGNGRAYDGQFFFSTTHKDGEGPTQTNKITTALSSTSYNTQRVNMQSLQDEEKQPLEIRPDLLIVGPSNEKTAMEIVQAGLVSGASGGFTNVFQGTARVAVSQRLVGAFAAFWFLADTSQAVKSLIWLDREAPRFDALMDMNSEAAFMRKEYQFGTSYRGGYGYGLWQFINGSDGTT